MTTLTVKLPAGLVRKLEAEAEPNKITKSEVIRRLLAQSLECSPSQSRLSCYDLAKDLCGSIKNAPKDLSSNKKYLDGFGE